MIGAAVAAGLGSLIGSGLNSIWGSYQSKDLMDYQSQLQQILIDKANWYNHPYNQMERLSFSGLNPNLVYGSGGVTGNQSDTGKVSTVNRDAGLNLGIQDAVQTHLNQKLVDQQVLESKSREVKNMNDTMGQILSNKLLRKTMAYQIDQMKENVNHTVQSIKESQRRVDKMFWETNNLKLDSNLLVERTKNEIKQGKILDLKPSEMRAHIRQMDSISDLNKKQLLVSDAKIKELVESAKWLASRTHGQDLENELTERMKSIGLQGMTTKDFFMLLKDLIISALK